MFDINAPAAATAMLNDPAVQQLLAQLCSLITALMFLVYAIATVIILNGTLSAYKRYCDLSRKGKYLYFYFDYATADKDKHIEGVRV
jgi:hypothetical protein